MKSYELFWKKEGETPLEALGRFRLQFSVYENEKLSYAGRLDPLAEGELLVLIGEENKNRVQYLGLEKEYEFEVLFGIGTDTHDLLGLVTDSDIEVVVTRPEIEVELASLIGKRSQAYPSFSSKTVAGKPLHQYAREDIETVPKQEHTITIDSLEILQLTSLSGSQLLKRAVELVGLVKGDFRQDEILKKWIETLTRLSAVYPLVRFRMRCSSGTYVRMLAHELGAKFSVPALAYSIRRTRIFVGEQQ